MPVPSALSGCASGCWEVLLRIHGKQPAKAQPEPLKEVQEKFSPSPPLADLPNIPEVSEPPLLPQFTSAPDLPIVDLDADISIAEKFGRKQVDSSANSRRASSSRPLRAEPDCSFFSDIFYTGQPQPDAESPFGQLLRPQNSLTSVPSSFPVRKGRPNGRPDDSEYAAATDWSLNLGARGDGSPNNWILRRRAEFAPTLASGPPAHAAAPHRMSDVLHSRATSSSRSRSSSNHSDSNTSGMFPTTSRGEVPPLLPRNSSVEKAASASIETGHTATTCSSSGREGSDGQTIPEFGDPEADMGCLLEPDAASLEHTRRSVLQSADPSPDSPRPWPEREVIEAEQEEDHHHLDDDDDDGVEHEDVDDDRPPSVFELDFTVEPPASDDPFDNGNGNGDDGNGHGRGPDMADSDPFDSTAPPPERPAEERSNSASASSASPSCTAGNSNPNSPFMDMAHLRRQDLLSPPWATPSWMKRGQKDDNAAKTIDLFDWGEQSEEVSGLDSDLNFNLHTSNINNNNNNTSPSSRSRSNSHGSPASSSTLRLTRQLQQSTQLAAWRLTSETPLVAGASPPSGGSASSTLLQRNAQEQQSLALSAGFLFEVDASKDERIEAVSADIGLQPWRGRTSDGKATELPQPSRWRIETPCLTKTQARQESFDRSETSASSTAQASSQAWARPRAGGVLGTRRFDQGAPSGPPQQQQQQQQPAPHLLRQSSPPPLQSPPIVPPLQLHRSQPPPDGPSPARSASSCESQHKGHFFGQGEGNGVNEDIERACTIFCQTE